MNIVYHDKPFKITKDNFPFGAHEDATVHVVDNFLTPELHRFWDSQIVSSSLWSKTNQVGSDSKTGLPQHSFWGGTFFNNMGNNDSRMPSDPDILKKDTYFAHYFNRKCETDFGFTWVNFDYMGLNSQTQGLDGTCHSDCDPNADWNLSILWYTNTFWNPKWGGDLRFYSDQVDGGTKEDMDKHEMGRVEFKPNRLLLFDGRTSHGAEAPNPSAKYIDRRSIVLRGTEIRLVSWEEQIRERTDRSRRFYREIGHDLWAFRE